MTERKPAGMTYGSWIDQQISAAQERGAFDDLPGAGKPLPPGRAEFDGQVWARDWVRREGGSPEDCLPTPLRLRKELERLDSDVAALRSEEKVREHVGELNERILAWRRLPLDGPPIHVRLADPEAVVAHWRLTQASTAEPAAAAEPDAVPRSRAFWKRRAKA